MSNKPLLLAGLAGITTFACGLAQAALLLHEDFESYSQGSIHGVAGGGTGVTGNWDNFRGPGYNVVAGLEGNNALQSVGGGTDNDVSISHTVSGWGSGQFWMSYMLNEQSYGGHFYVSAGGGFPGAFGHGWSSNFGINNESGPGNVSYTQGETYRLVALIDFDAGETSVWVDPTSDPSATTPDIFKTEVQDSTQTLIIRAYGTSATVDDVRVGTTFADVVPEPGSLALVGLGGLALLRRRRPITH